MSFKNFCQLYAAGRIRRFHTADSIVTQTLAQHSWGVAMIVAHIYKDASPNLLRATLTHDLAELWTGDIPSPAKWRFPNLYESSRQVEEEFNREHQIEYSLSDFEQYVLEWADMFEGLIWCRHQVNLGNMYARNIELRYLSWFKGKEYPTPAAKDLWSEFVGE